MNSTLRRNALSSIFLALALLHANPAGADFRQVTLSYSAVSMTWFPVKVALEIVFSAMKAWSLN